MKKSILFIIVISLSSLLFGCLSEQELARRAQAAKLNQFKINLCADEPSKWKPALKKLFERIDKGDPEAIKLLTEMANLTGDKTYNDTRINGYKETGCYKFSYDDKIRATAKLEITGPRYKCVGEDCKSGDGIITSKDGWCPGHTEWLAFTTTDCSDQINEKVFELALKNVPLATRKVSEYVLGSKVMFRYFKYNSDSYGLDGVCIANRFWCKWGMHLIDVKAAESPEISFEFAWYVGNSEFTNRGISSGWGDRSFSGLPNIESYPEKFFTEYAEKGNPVALSKLFWGLTTEPSYGSWKYNSRALKVLKDLALTGNKDAINYLIRIMNEESAQSNKDVRYTGNYFIALENLVEIQKKAPNILIHNALMKAKNETTITAVYEYIENYYQ